MTQGAGGSRIFGMTLYPVLLTHQSTVTYKVTDYNILVSCWQMVNYQHEFNSFKVYVFCIYCRVFSLLILNLSTSEIHSGQC